MGAFLSEPITDKVSTDEEGERVICGASSMQGWRISQEDAHNSILDYDTNTSFFAVYDGHGGHEVAAYTAQHLPRYLKNCEAYNKGDYTQALKDAFLEFDATLTTPEVVAVLKQIASNKDGEQNTSSDEEENVKNLYEEAQMPLEEVMAKYQKDLLGPNAKKTKQEDGKPPVSAYLRARRLCALGASSSGLSSSSSKVSTSRLPESGNGSIESDSEVTDSKKEDAEVSSSSSQKQSISSSSKSSQHLGNSEADQASDSSTSNGEMKPVLEESEEIDTSKSKTPVPDSSGDAEVSSQAVIKHLDKTEDHSEDENSSKKVLDASDIIQEVNGETGEGCTKDETVDQNEKNSEGVTSSIPHENGEVGEREGKGKSSPSKISSSQDTNKEDKRRIQLRSRTATALYRELLRSHEDSDSDSDDEGDESFEGNDNSSSSDDNDESDNDEDEGVEDDAGEEESNEENEEEDDDSMVDDEEDEDEDFAVKMTEKPGADSGCTAVVALLKGQELYVANAGDSRCIVCRNGQAIEMSLDHKPEDKTEKDRIVKAGGFVTSFDGRVNGGLNLSRALGDHAYKQSEGLPPQEQMITALPDVRTLMIDPKEDEFMVLACDGIWNFMSSQEVVDFVRPRMQENKTKLSQICEELFDHCLAPDTLGDGTGCDNMTAVIIKFLPELANRSESKSVKRAASPTIESSSDIAKRPKTEESEAAACV